MKTIVENNTEKPFYGLKMLRLFKKIFSREEKVKETIELIKLSEWFDSKADVEFNKVNSKLKERYSLIRKEVENLRNAVNILEKTEVKEKVDDKVRNIVLSNKKNYINQVNLFLEDLHLPDNMEYRNAIEFYNNFQSSIDNLSKSSLKSYNASKHLFFDEVDAVAKILKNLDKISKDIKLNFDDSNSEQLDEIKSKINDYLNCLDKKKKSKEKLKQNKNNLKELQNKIKKLGNEIEKFETSKDFASYNKLLEKREQIEKKITDLEDELLNKFSILTRPLKKYEKITLLDTRLIQRYINNPYDALILDKELEIIKVFQNLKKNVSEDKLELKDKVKEKVLSRMEELTPDKLKEIILRAEELNRDRANVLKGIRESTVPSELKELQNKLNKEQNLLENTKTGIKEIEEKADINLDDMKEEISREINNNLGIEVEIR